MSIRFDSVHKSFGENTVLRGVSFELADNTLYSLTGPSGAGKTTLLRLISELETPDGGRILRNGGVISYAFQEPRLFPQLNVRENLLLIQPRISVPEMLRALDLNNDAEKYPHELSGGMKKRAGLARALSAAADVYLLDEPTAGQDSEHARMVADAICKYTKGAVTVVSTHDADLIDALDGKILRLQDGMVSFTDEK